MRVWASARAASALTCAVVGAVRTRWPIRLELSCKCRRRGEVPDRARPLPRSGDVRLLVEDGPERRCRRHRIRRPRGGLPARPAPASPVDDAGGVRLGQGQVDVLVAPDHEAELGSGDVLLDDDTLIHRYAVQGGDRPGPGMVYGAVELFGAPDQAVTPGAVLFGGFDDDRDSDPGTAEGVCRLCGRVRADRSRCGHLAGAKELGKVRLVPACLGAPGVVARQPEARGQMGDEWGEELPVAGHAVDPLRLRERGQVRRPRGWRRRHTRRVPGRHPVHGGPSLRTLRSAESSSLRAVDRARRAGTINATARAGSRFHVTACSKLQSAQDPRPLRDLRQAEHPSLWSKILRSAP